MIIILTGDSGIKIQFHFILIFLFTLMLSCSIKAQSWDSVKEKDGFKIIMT